jgi:O-acetylhomoserine (thiol)-lyase
MERAGQVYSRLSKPTKAALQERIATLHNGIGAIASASGQAAASRGIDGALTIYSPTP